MIYRVDTEEYGIAYIFRPEWALRWLRKRLHRRGVTTLGRIEPESESERLARECYEQMRERAEKWALAMLNRRISW